MAVTVFPAASTGGSGFGEVSSRTVIELVANTNKIVKLSDLGGLGTYRISFYTNDASAASTVSINESDSLFGGLAVTNMVAIPNTERSYKFLTMNNSTVFLTFNATEAGFVIADKLTQLSSPPVTITAYTNSQSVTLATSAIVALVGGGGGGGGGNDGRTGGGSGYLTTFTAPAGTHSLVVGAGGASNTNGGWTSFWNYQVPGGYHGNTGGAGGSGGGYGGWYSGSQAGGSNGLGSGGSTGTNGSGTQFVGFYSYGNGGSGVGYGGTAAGGGGGTYAGGGGSNQTNAYGSGGGGNGTGIGGGGGGGLSAGGGTGANGGAIIVTGV
jgi:hypothetical protein